MGIHCNLLILLEKQRKLLLLAGSFGAQRVLVVVTQSSVEHQITIVVFPNLAVVGY
jgi:hypothetical protein